MIYYTGLLSDAAIYEIYRSEEEAKEGIFKMIKEGWQAQGAKKWLERL